MENIITTENIITENCKFATKVLARWAKKGTNTEYEELSRLSPDQQHSIQQLRRLLAAEKTLGKKQWYLYTTLKECDLLLTFADLITRRNENRLHRSCSRPVQQREENKAIDNAINFGHVSSCYYSTYEWEYVMQPTIRFGWFKNLLANRERFDATDALIF